MWWHNESKLKTYTPQLWQFDARLIQLSSRRCHSVCNRIILQVVLTVANIARPTLPSFNSIFWISTGEFVIVREIYPNWLVLSVSWHLRSRESPKTDPFLRREIESCCGWRVHRKLKYLRGNYHLERQPDVLEVRY